MRIARGRRASCASLFCCPTALPFLCRGRAVVVAGVREALLGCSAFRSSVIGQGPGNQCHRLCLPARLAGTAGFLLQPLAHSWTSAARSAVPAPVYVNEQREVALQDLAVFSGSVHHHDQYGHGRFHVGPGRHLPGPAGVDGHHPVRLSVPHADGGGLSGRPPDGPAGAQEGFPDGCRAADAGRRGRLHCHAGTLLHAAHLRAHDAGCLHLVRQLQPFCRYRRRSAGPQATGHLAGGGRWGDRRRGRSVPEQHAA